MKYSYSLLLFSLIFWTACSSDDKKVEEIRPANGVTDIIRNPITADGNIDTVNIAKMEFVNAIISFGEANEGDTIRQAFKFKNTGKIPLLINDARAVCGCTVPSWPKESIPPGGEGEIVVQFNTAGRIHDQNRDVTVIANTYPKENVIALIGYVNPLPPK